MPLLPPTFIGSLDSTNPRGTDSRTISDDYHRMIQESCRMTLPNLTGEVTSTHQDLNLLSGLAAQNAKPLTGDAGTTIAFFQNATPPTGWVLFAPDANVKQLMVGPATEPDTGGDSDPRTLTSTINISIAGTTGGTAITVDQMPAHDHGGDAPLDRQALTNTRTDLTPPQLGAIYYVDPPVTGFFEQNFATKATVASQGGGNAHDHSFSGSNSDSFTLTPRYARGILCRLASG